MTARRQVEIMSGPREHRLRLPIESRFDITVRPAYRPPEENPSWLEIILERSFDRVGLIFAPIVIGLICTIVVVQVYHHFHPLSAFAP